MKLDFFSALAIVVSTLVAFAALSNLAVLVFTKLGMAKAAAVASRIGGFVTEGLHVAEDMAASPTAAAALQAGLADLEKLAMEDAAVQVALARIKSGLKGGAK